MTERMALGEGDILVSLADAAKMAGVTRPAVSNWRRRYEDFPEPVEETGTTSLFRLADLSRWMHEHGKRFAVPSLEQHVWSALNQTRGMVKAEDAAEAGMILLGYVALATRLGEAEESALQSAFDRHSSALSHQISHLEVRAQQFGLGDTFTIRPFLSWPGSWEFFRQLLDLGRAFGVGEVFEALVAASARGSRGEGEHATPAPVADLIMTLASPIKGSVLDPACGHGTFLLAASRKAKGQLTLLGQDINDTSCLITRLRMLVHGLSADVRQADTLHGPPPSDTQADLVVADPPFGMLWRPEATDAYERLPFGVPPPSRPDMAWLQYGISRLQPTGLAMFILPPASLFQGGRAGEVRRGLIEAGCVQAVVSLPPSLYPTTSIPVALWVVGRPRQHPADLLLIDASQLGYRRRNRTELSAADIATIDDCYRTWCTRKQLFTTRELRAVAVPISALVADDAVLDPSRWIQEPPEDPQQYLNRITAAVSDLQTAGTAFTRASAPLASMLTVGNQTTDGWVIRRLSELATVMRTRRIDPDAIGTGSTPVIRVKDLGPGLTITPSDHVDLDLLNGPVVLTQPGDVVALADGAQPRAAVDPVGGAVVNAPLQVLRPHPNSIDSIVLAALLTTLMPKYALGTSIKHVKLPELDIPCPDMEVASWLRQTLEALDEQRRQALAAVQAIDTLRVALVDGLSSQTLQFDPETSR
jgi:hypothetical protein